MPASLARRRTAPVTTATLLECSRRHPVSTHLHVSTIEVYGELAADREHFTEGSPLNEITNLEIVNRSLTGLASTPPSGGKIERDLGWRPETGFAEGLAATVDW